MNKHFKTVIHFHNHLTLEITKQFDKIKYPTNWIGSHELCLIIKSERADEFGIALMEDINVMSVEKFNQWVENLDLDDTI